ncbi:MAG: Mth938-like domain-containing protein [Xanthobacteraceae bacterium]
MGEFEQSDGNFGSAAPQVDAPHLPHQALIDAHGGGGFRFSGMSHRGSLLCFPSGVWAWAVGEPAAITAEALSLVFVRGSELDFFIIGTGEAPWVMPEPLRQKFRQARISVDAMTTGPAMRTYNVMMMEGRRVGAALIAID